MKALIRQADKRKKTAGSFRFLLLQRHTLWEQRAAFRLACEETGKFNIFSA